jgi:hypothetical protein
MLEYESLYELFKSLGVLNNPNMHFFDTVDWVLVEFMYMQVQDAIVKAIKCTRFLTCSCDEVITIDKFKNMCSCLHG